MKKLLKRLFERLTHAKIHKQLNTMYIIAILVPIVILGSFLVGSTYKLLINYHTKIVQSDNLRVKTFLFEMTSQIYNISDEITFEPALQEMLAIDYVSDEQFMSGAQKYTGLDNYINNHSEIDSIKIYVDNDKVKDSKPFYEVTDEIEMSSWYKKAISQFSVFWCYMKETDDNGNDYYKLALVRKVPLLYKEGNAVLVMTINENYLKKRIENNDYITLVAVNEDLVFYGTDKKYYGQPLPIDVDYQDPFYQYTGNIVLAGKRCLTCISTLTMYQSDSNLYIASINTDAYGNITGILTLCIVIILLAAGLPAILVQIFNRYLTGRITALREEMHKASMEEYDEVDEVEALPGEDEISQAHNDLRLMVSNIKEKDSEMYKSQINEQALLNEQQLMEFKMLSSQINPHFLYNTLETIRMKALTEGNPEVSTAIKLLGKSLRYVLENNGTTSTTLKNELTHIEIYLIIQRMRFSERVNYEIKVEEGLNLEEYEILPLLLQPIVENAINHGLEEIEKYGLVTISVATRADDFLLIDIEDNGIGMDEETLNALNEKLRTPNMRYKSSIGLYNISQRIRLFYGEKYSITIKSKIGKGTLVSLCLPLKNIEEYGK